MNGSPSAVTEEFETYERPACPRHRSRDLPSEEVEARSRPGRHRSARRLVPGVVLDPGLADDMKSVRESSTAGGTPPGTPPDDEDPPAWAYEVAAGEPSDLT